MPALQVFKMIGRILKYEPAPEDEPKEENVRQVTRQTATDNWPSGKHTFRI